MSATMPPMMSSKDFLKSTTPNNPFKRGRSSLLHVDLLMRQADPMTTLPLAAQVKLMAQLCREIRTWQTRKANKATSNAETRRAVVQRLGDQAFARLQYLTFEQRKAKGAQANLKGLSAGYAHERTTYEASGKTKAVAGSTASALVKNATSIGATVTKPFSQLTQKEYEDLVLGYAPGEMMPTEVKFMAKSERIGHLVYVEEGYFWESASSRFNTQGDNIEHYPYAMDRYGNIFSTNHHEAEATLTADQRFNHSSFNAGKDVICAGMIGIVKGKLKYIDNNSGHYKAGRQHVRNALQVLRGSGVELAGSVKVGVKEIGSNGREVFHYWDNALAWLLDPTRPPDDSFQS